MVGSDEWDETAFGDKVIARLARIAKVADDAGAIDRLRAELVPIGVEYRRVIAGTPSELRRSPSTDTLSQRLDWIDAQVLNPLTKLIAAVQPGNRAMFSMWPEEVSPKLLPDLDTSLKHLMHLQLLGQNVAIVLAKYRFHDLPFGQLIRYGIVASAADALSRALPDLTPTRGTYDKETRGFNGVYPDLIRAIYKEITGEDEQLDRLIREQVDARRG